MNALYPDALGGHVIESLTNRLADVVGSFDADTPVPTCGQWTLVDLAWHLVEVQAFWTSIITNRPAGPEIHVPPVRPESAHLAGALRGSVSDLVGALRGCDPLEQAWSWSDDHTVGFTMRRQTHEALIHSIDGHLAVGSDLPAASAELAADGIDELIRVMVGGVPSWAEFSAGETTIDLHTTDTPDAWRMRIGRMTGTSPDSGNVYDLSAYEVEPMSAEPADATITGTALDLDLWCWGRAGFDPLDRSGDQQLVDDLRAAVGEATQ